MPGGNKKSYISKVSGLFKWNIWSFVTTRHQWLKSIYIDHNFVTLHWMPSYAVFVAWGFA